MKRTKIPDHDCVGHRMRLHIRGKVQGVGFRPFVYRLACELGLSGWVRNSPQGVQIELEGKRTKLDEFVADLETKKPKLAYIQSREFSFHDAVGYSGFKVLESV
ncbi:MAG: acylphosphatase, partial [candidate division Zixibacteria bacterium]|nr:acylphosphatase [candidate division Zixibacteria bacterium]